MGEKVDDANIYFFACFGVGSGLEFGDVHIYFVLETEGSFFE